jgi:hypothetical protein
MRTSRPDLTPDAATQVAIDAPDAVALIGYLGIGESDRVCQLYQTVGMDRWLTIPVAAIVARSAAPTAGQSVLWVKRDTRLQLCTTVRASCYENPCTSQEDPTPPMPSAWPRP